MTFDSLGLVAPLLSAVRASGYSAPTPVQAQAIPLLLAGRDVCATAQTGTGKTAAFALPLLQRLASRPGPPGIRALVLAPTRELAVQIDAALGVYGAGLTALSHAVVYGGMPPRAQRRALAVTPAVLVATPGRLIDLVGHGQLSLGRVEILVLDEADRMLDLGFADAVKQLVALTPTHRQTALFSATLPRPIATLARAVLRDPARVSVARPAAVADGIRQLVYFVEPPAKRGKLVEILADPAITSALVFTRTRHGVERIHTHLRKAGIRAAALHGDKPQAERTRVLRLFAEGQCRVLVATDVAARGLDIDGVTHVLNYDLPNVPETYVHRIGRTARAGARGVAISLCATNELGHLAQIERLTGQKPTPVREG